MTSGIYSITCNLYVYIGSTKNFEKRWKQHLANLRNNKHPNIILQRIFDKYGESSLVFKIEENIPYTKDQIMISEQEWIDKVRAQVDIKCMNLSDASFGDVLTNHPNREDIISRISNTVNANIQVMTPDERKQKWGRHGENNGMFGKTHSDETRQKFRDREISDETRQKQSVARKQVYQEKPELREHLSKLASLRVGELNSFYGRTHTAETKAKIAAVHLGVKPPNRRKVLVNGVVYDSITDAGNALGIPKPTVHHRINSKNKKFENYTYIEMPNDYPERE